jgi:hypothetical protein
MKLIAVTLLLLAVVGLAACAETPRMPQCEGPWMPVNPPIEAADET